MSFASRIAGMSRPLNTEEFQALGGQVWLTPKAHRTHTDPPAEYMHLLTETGYDREQHGSVVRLPDREEQSYWTGEDIISELDTSVAYHEAYLHKLAAGLSLGLEPSMRNPFSSAGSTPAPASVASRARTVSSASTSTRAATPKVSTHPTTTGADDKHEDVQHPSSPASSDSPAAKKKRRRFEGEAAPQAGSRHSKDDIEFSNGNSIQRKLKKIRQVGEEIRSMLESMSSDAINPTQKPAKIENIVNIFLDGAIKIQKSIEHNIVDEAFKKVPDQSNIRRQTGMDMMTGVRDVIKFGMEHVLSQDAKGEPLPDMIYPALSETREVGLWYINCYTLKATFKPLPSSGRVPIWVPNGLGK